MPECCLKSGSKKSSRPVSRGLVVVAKVIVCVGLGADGEHPMIVKTTNNSTGNRQLATGNSPSINHSTFDEIASSRVIWAFEKPGGRGDLDHRAVQQQTNAVGRTSGLKQVVR